MKNPQFPDGFYWGAATSSHQVEGGNTNDWSEWEKIPDKVKTGEVSGKAANSWELYEKDFDLLQEMNLNMYRLSIEWSRIEPSPGQFDQNAIATYRRMLESLRSRNIEPVVTLHHFTNPLWVEGWTKQSTVDAYLQYVSMIVESLGEHVRYWVTINEPNVYVTMGYMQGAWPPGKKNFVAEYKALRKMHKAHNQAYDVINKIYEQHNWQKPFISMAFNLQAFLPIKNTKTTKFTTRLANYFTNDYSIVKTLNNLDFIGVNHYFTHWVKGFSWNNDPENIPRNNLQWPIYPPGFYEVLMETKKHNLPILVTENGIPDAQDKLRSWFIASYTHEMHRAINDGAPVFGYLHWSLLDNFEWWDGFSGRFGLAETNFINFKRKIRDSGRLYGTIAKTNALPDVIPENPPS